MRLSLLGSGSQGNVAYVEATHAGHTTRLLVDAGLSRAETERRLALIDPRLTLADIDGVLITHDHNDHAAHAKSLRRPLWATAGTRRKRRLEATRVISGCEVRVGSLAVMPVLLPHDGDETVAFVFEDSAGARAAIVTDCGHPTAQLAQAFGGLDLLVIEANHEPGLLASGPYPPSIQRRVSGDRGHLSNAQSAALYRALCRHGGPPAQVVLAHLSRANNTPALARAAYADLVDDARLYIAAQDQPTPLFDIAARRPRVRRQLTFDFSLALESA